MEVSIGASKLRIIMVNARVLEIVGFIEKLT
jgi:hypothetical protein